MLGSAHGQRYGAMGGETTIESPGVQDANARCEVEFDGGASELTVEGEPACASCDAQRDAVPSGWWTTNLLAPPPPMRTRTRL